MNIYVLSPYRRQFAYPSFWRLIDQISVNNKVTFYFNNRSNKWIDRVIYDSKFKHITTIFFLFVSIFSKRKEKKIIITFGIYQIFFAFIAKRFNSKIVVVTYQPELFEFNSGILTFIFKKFVAFNDLLIDVDKLRLKLRKRYFKNLPNSIILANFDHQVVQSYFKKQTISDRNVYAGGLDKIDWLYSFCDHFSLELKTVDCYLTRFTAGNKTQKTGINFLDARPFPLIAGMHDYNFGIISYPFTNRCRKDLGYKYCAPSKLFTYLSYGIKPLHYDHPTLKEYTKLNISFTNKKMGQDSELDFHAVSMIFEKQKEELKHVFNFFENYIKAI